MAQPALTPGDEPSLFDEQVETALQSALVEAVAELRQQFTY